jgi:transposase
MTQVIANPSPVTIGLDVGDRNTHHCVLDSARSVVVRGSFATTRKELSKTLAPFRGARVALEAGSQSPWMSRHLRNEGFDVHVVDPRRVQLISKDPRKTDRRDAEVLARLEAGMPELLGTIHHRGEQAQADLSIIRARDLLVRMRTMAVQQIRSLSKAFGVRLPAVSTAAFPQRIAALAPSVLQPAIAPLRDLITDLTRRIREYERVLAQVAKERYPEIAVLQQVRGVGPVTAAALVLSIEDPTRFADSRHVGSWLGLCPRNHASGDSDPELRVSKAGDGYLRRLLVQCAHYILGPFGEDCDLKRFGQRLAARGGSGAKKRAAVAVARKLAVLLHRLWRNGLVYEPLHQAKRQAALPAV